MTDTRNIILIGKTGNGKSTLANVITWSDKFKESEYGVSETKNAQAEIIEEDGVKYRIIDTIGIGDTQWTTKQVLVKIADAIHMAKEGVSQVLFVTSGRFTREEIDAYDLMRTILFNEDIVKYTTIVRTRFSKFDKPADTEKDKELLANENPDIADVVRTCNKIIHVDNPPMNTGNDSYDALGLSIREKSKERLLLHLSQCKGIYKPESLDKINQRIGGYMDEKEKKEKEIEELKRMIEKQKQLSMEEKQGYLNQIAEEEKATEQLKGKIAGEMKDIVTSKADQLAQTTEDKRGLFERWGGTIGYTADAAVETVSKCRIS